MSKKKLPVWKSLILGLGLSLAVEAAGVLLAALLILRGQMTEEHLLPFLCCLALLAALLGGVAAGWRGAAGGRGSLLNAGVFATLLAALCLGSGEEIAGHGWLLLGMILAGGLLGALLCGKVGERRGKRLVKSNKRRKFR